MPTVLAIDAPAWMHRAIHARTRLDPRELVLGSIRTMIGKFRPTHVVAAFDGPREKLERRQLLPAYKAHRRELDDDTRTRLDRCKAFVRDIGICSIHIPRWEADDVLATIARICQGPECEVIIASPDKDLGQCVTDAVTLWTGKEVLDAHGVSSKWGVPPAKVVDVQILAGDSSDGIPGAKGIGVAKAVKLVQAYGSARAAVDNRESLSPAQRKALEALDVDLAEKLVRLRTDLALPIRAADMRWRGLDSDAVSAHLD